MKKILKALFFQIILLAIVFSSVGLVSAMIPPPAPQPWLFNLCNPAASDFTLSPPNQQVQNTQTPQLTAAVKNNSQAPCPAKNYAFSMVDIKKAGVEQTDWNSSFSPASVDVPPGGQTGTSSLTLTPPADTEGTFDITVRVTTNPAETIADQTAQVTLTSLPTETNPVDPVNPTTDSSRKIIISVSWEENGRIKTSDFFSQLSSF